MRVTAKPGAHPVVQEIARRMNEKQQTAKGLSLKAELGPTYIGDLLRGRSEDPGIAKLEKIATCLDCGLIDLILGPEGLAVQDRSIQSHPLPDSEVASNPEESALLLTWRELSDEEQKLVLGFIEWRAGTAGPSRKRGGQRGDQGSGGKGI